MAARDLPSVKAVATIGAPAEPEGVAKLLSSREEVESAGEAEVTLAGRTFKVKKQFLDDLNKIHMKDVIHGLRRPLLIFHSPVDNIVGVSRTRVRFFWRRGTRKATSRSTAPTTS